MHMLSSSRVRALTLVLSLASLAACGGSSTSPSPNDGGSGSSGGGTGGGGSSSGTTISIVNGAFNLTTTAFNPNPITVPVGTTVTWRNNDSTTHDATADNKSFATGLISPGASASVTLSTAGRVTYYCTIHPGMTGTIDVQ
jgi:plastocyanin